MLIRPALVRRLLPWRPSLAAGALALLGIWTFSRGGLVFWPLGGAMIALGVAWLTVELAHLRLRGQADAPGVVEVEEGALRYFGAPAPGGEVALRDLAEIRILRLNARPHWQVRTRDGMALLIPADAVGTDRLADAFATLPGADIPRIAAALARARQDGTAAQTVWKAPGFQGMRLLGNP